MKDDDFFDGGRVDGAVNVREKDALNVRGLRFGVGDGSGWFPTHDSGEFVGVDGITQKRLFQIGKENIGNVQQSVDVGSAVNKSVIREVFGYKILVGWMRDMVAFGNKMVNSFHNGILIGNGILASIGL